MRFVFISDTHLQHEFVVPNGDVLVHCGDFTMKGSAGEIREFDDWLQTLRHPYKVVIAGNHDLGFEDCPEVARRLLKTPIYLQDSDIRIDGVKIYGSPWQPWSYDWAFNLPRGRALAEKWDLIPADIDILVTHGPPHGILDQNLLRESCGCEELREAVDRIKPRIHAFGHIHCAHGVERIGETLFVNACVCTERYAPGQEPIVVDLLPNGATEIVASTS